MSANGQLRIFGILVLIIKKVFSDDFDVVFHFFFIFFAFVFLFLVVH